MSRRIVIVLLGLGVGCIVAGLAVWHPAAGLVGAGIAILGLVTFDPDHAGKLRWPR
jgi:hypothetical protein